MANSRSSISSSDARREAGERRRFARAAARLLAPFVLVVAVELWVLPLDAFARRAWEALVVRRVGPAFVLTGPFYPGHRLVIAEEGDLVIGTPLATRRTTEWRTDAHGFRTDDAGAAPDVVLVGDSLVAGASLTQADTLAETLGRRVRRRVYPFAPAEVGEVLVDERFADGAAPVVVLVTFERFLRFMAPVAPPAELARLRRERRNDGWTDSALRAAKASPWVRHPAIWWNRLEKANMLRWTRARVRSLTTPPRPVIRSGDVCFLEGGPANAEIADVDVTKVAALVKGYRDALRADGTRFVFMPVPNKESVLWRRLEPRNRPTFLRRVTAATRALGIETVELQPAFEAAVARGVPVYRPDDTHWNPAGVGIAAASLADALRVP